MGAQKVVHAAAIAEHLRGKSEAEGAGNGCREIDLGLRGQPQVVVHELRDRSANNEGQPAAKGFGKASLHMTLQLEREQGCIVIGKIEVLDQSGLEMHDLDAQERHRFKPASASSAGTSVQ